jgi:hypothetical protein
MERFHESVALLHAGGADVCVVIQLSYEPADSLRPTHAAYIIDARRPGFDDFVRVDATVIRNESSDPNCTA